MTDPITKSHGGPLRVGIGGPVGSGKTAIIEAIAPRSTLFVSAA